METFELTEAAGRAYVEEAFESRFDRAEGTEPSPLQVYADGYAAYRADGYIEHYAALSAVTDARQRMIRFVEGHREPEAPGTVGYYDILFSIDHDLRFDHLTSGASPRDRRMIRREFRALASEFGFSYRLDRVRAIRFIAESGGIGSLVDEGIYLNARALSRNAERDADAVTLSRLALMYQEGLGVQKDREEAERLLQRAMKLGSIEAADELASLYFTELETIGGPIWDRDRTLAPEHYRLAAEGGSAKGMFNLAGMYYRGFGVERDLGMAQSWFDRAASAAPTEWFGEMCTTWSERVEDAAQRESERAAAQQRAADLESLEGNPLAAVFYAVAQDRRIATAAMSFAALVRSVEGPPPCDAFAGSIVNCTWDVDYYDMSTRYDCNGDWLAEGMCRGEGLCNQRTGRMYLSYDDAVADICRLDHGDDLFARLWGSAHE